MLTQLVVDNGYIKNSEKSDLGTADEEFIDPEELKSLYSKEKDGFHVDYHDPYENDRDLQRKLKFNSMIPSKRKFQPTSDYESDCFQEFVDNNMKKQTRNMPYFCKYFNIPQEIYGHFGLDPNAFR